MEKIGNVFLMDKGKIMVYGSHSKLLETCDEYIKIFGKLEKEVR